MYVTRTCVSCFTMLHISVYVFFFFFFFNATATTEIYTLSLHDALPICLRRRGPALPQVRLRQGRGLRRLRSHRLDRKSTRLNSSHMSISYAVFCLKKKKKKKQHNFYDNNLHYTHYCSDRVSAARRVRSL